MNFKNQLIKKLVSYCKLKPIQEGGNKRFLILSTTGLGDTLWGTPAIRALRTCFPNAYIGVITSSIGKVLLQNNPRIDELFVINYSPLFSLIPLYFTLKSKKITHVLSFHTSQRLILPLAATTGAHTLIGTRGINKGLDCLLSHPLDPLPTHEIERRLNIVEQVGAYTCDFSMELFLGSNEENAAQRFLSSLKIPLRPPFIALHPGAKDTFKQWPATQFTELGNRLTRALGGSIIVTGTLSEKKLVESIASKIPGASAAIDLPLPVMAALIKKMNLMIANDTGPMHLAFAMKTPTLGLFTPTNPALCGPYFVENTQAIARNPTCSPCLKKKCREPFCLLQIGVQEVYDAALKLLCQSQ